MFDTLSDRLSGALRDLRGKGRLSDADIDATAREIRIALLEADVALPVVRAFINRIKERAKGAEVSGALNPAQQVVKIVNDELINILGGETRRLRLAKEPPTVIMLAGLQGSGKTTLAGKLARWLKGQGHTPLLVACDLQRPNAVTQLQIVGERAGVPTFAPHPGASATGQQTSRQRCRRPGRRRPPRRRARRREALRHRDRRHRGPARRRRRADARRPRTSATPCSRTRPCSSSTRWSARTPWPRPRRSATGSGSPVWCSPSWTVTPAVVPRCRCGRSPGEPILFASNGEKLADFDVFHPDRMASRILGMGDLLTLIEQAEQHFDAEQTAKTAAKIGTGELTLEDFLDQMLTIRKMGPIGNILGMLPGANQMKDQLAQVDDRQLDKLQAIIRGMTPAERADPKIINGSRRLRIANGSGVAVGDVNDLVNRFFEARKMMKQMAGQFGFGSRSATKRLAKSRKGKKGTKGKPVARPGARTPAGMPDLSALPPSLRELPPGLGGMDQLPPGFDPSKLKFPKGK